MIKLHSDEIAYLKSNSDRIIRRQAMHTVLPEFRGWRTLDVASTTAQVRAHESEIAEQIDEDSELFRKEIDQEDFTARFTIEPGAPGDFTQSKVLEIVFSNPDPQHIGVIEYHGPNRIFNRERITNINVNLNEHQDQRMQNILYNQRDKYANVKSELASVYVRDMLAEKAGVPLSTASSSLTDTLKELFTTFFPDKEFLGPRPRADGGLDFPVSINGSAAHDLDDLSSGEKEILYGYLRLYNAATKHSIIMLDEPELHLNPRLARGLPEFYHRHLSGALDNQIWLITHSDAILRESVSIPGTSIFHMTPTSYLAVDQRQTNRIKVDKDLERAIIDLVGDVALYMPGAKIVLLEGEDSEFDVDVVSKLFPELVSTANLIPGTNKHRVQGLHSILEKLSKAGRLPEWKVFSIVDRDSESDTNFGDEATRLVWDAYHIENYLLNERYIKLVLTDINLIASPISVDQVLEGLKECARETLPSLVSHKIGRLVNESLMAVIKTGVSPESSNMARDLATAAMKSVERISSVLRNELTEQKLSGQVRDANDGFERDLNSGEWKKSFRGRDVLRRFAGRFARGMNYEYFRNLIVSKMRDDRFKPEGMANVINAILTPPVVPRQADRGAGPKRGRGRTQLGRGRRK